MIPPGGEGRIEVTLRPKGGHTDITKDIVVHSNDPEQPRFTLTMKGRLLVDMVAEPAHLVLRDLPPGQPGTALLSIQRSDDSTAEIESARVEDTTSFSLRPVDPERGALATYELRFAGRKEPGTSATKVIVKTTGDYTPELTIPVRANAAFNLRYPKRFGFTQRDGRPLARTIRISTRRGDPPKLSKVEDPDDLLDVEILPPQGPSTSIRMTLREDALERASAKKLHTLRVHTDDPDEPVIELQYQVVTGRPKQLARPAGH